MTLPFDDILSADSAVTRAVLLSERTQLLAIKALQIAESRAEWEETTDAEWDDIDKAIGEAEYEILTLQDLVSLELSHTEAWRLSNQSIAASTDTPIIWTHGDFDGTNPTRLYFPISGIATISVNVAILYTTVALPTIWFRFNGLSNTDSARERSDANLLSHYFNETWTREVVAGQYVEAWINTGAQGANVSFSTFVPRIVCSIVGEG